MRLWFTLALAALVQGVVPQVTPTRGADELLAADRAFSARASRVGLVEGLTPMLADTIIVPGPPATLYRGLTEVTAFLGASPDATARASWTPIRVGLSADGLHGFTFGFMTLSHRDGRTVPMKYMAYWIKNPGGWRVAGYKRARRPEGEASMAMMPPLLPAEMTAPRSDPAWLDQQRASLVSAERAFSDEAQAIGLGPAFVKYGQATSVNMGGPANASYVVGADAIGQLVGRGQPPGTPSPVEWSTDVALVASSGDLGVSFGFIRPNARPAAGAAPDGQPFFTIWSRGSTDAPWRYIAE